MELLSRIIKCKNLKFTLFSGLFIELGRFEMRAFSGLQCTSSGNLLAVLFGDIIVEAFSKIDYSLRESSHSQLLRARSL